MHTDQMSQGLAVTVFAFFTLLSPFSSLAHQAISDCSTELMADDGKSPYDSAELQMEYIRRIQNLTGSAQSKAFESLYANYAAMIEGMAAKHARNHMRNSPGSFADQFENFTQIGRVALFEAAKKYDLKYPKPGSYLHRYIYYYMIDTVNKRDGQLTPPMLMRRFNQQKRHLLFEGRIDELFQSLNGSVSREDLESLHSLVKMRTISLNEQVGDGSGLERLESLEDEKCIISQMLYDEELRGLVKKAIQAVKQSLSERDRKIAEARTFCDQEDAKPTRDLAKDLGVSHETVRLVDLKIKSKIKNSLQSLILNPETFTKSLSDDEADIARERVFADTKKTRKQLAEWLGWSEKRIEETEKMITQKYNAALRQNLLELLATEPQLSGHIGY